MKYKYQFQQEIIYLYKYFIQVFLLYSYVWFYCYSTVLSVEFDRTNYTGSEKSGHLSVTLLLKGGRSADDIAVTVTPSDQSPVSAEG